MAAVRLSELNLSNRVATLEIFCKPTAAISQSQVVNEIIATGFVLDTLPEVNDSSLANMHEPKALILILHGLIRCTLKAVIKEESSMRRAFLCLLNLLDRSIRRGHPAPRFNDFVYDRADS